MFVLFFQLRTRATLYVTVSVRRFVRLQSFTFFGDCEQKCVLDTKTMLNSNRHLHSNKKENKKGPPVTLYRLIRCKDRMSRKLRDSRPFSRFYAS